MRNSQKIFIKQINNKIKQKTNKNIKFMKNSNKLRNNKEILQ